MKRRRSREKISADAIRVVISETLITAAHIDLWLRQTFAQEKNLAI